MRITSSMMTNNMMLNLNRSMRNVDKYWLQFSTTRRIHVPSDNPLIAARAMKFRTNLVQNEDFQSNVEQGLAWMDVTEGSLDNVVQILMNEARDLFNRGANDWLSLENRNTIIAQLRGIHTQLGIEMNTQFAGRYVFSGLRTDQPPFFTTDRPELVFEITQHFNLGDIERTYALQIFDPTPTATAPGEYVLTLPHNPAIHRLKLPYRGTGVGLPQIAGGNGQQFHVVEWSNTQMGAYDVRLPHNPAIHINYPGMTTGTFNPDIPTNYPGMALPGVFDPDLHINYPGMTTGTFNPNIATNFPPDPLNPGNLPVVHFIRETGELIFHSDHVTGSNGVNNFTPRMSITYTREGFLRGEPNPMVYFESVLLNGTAGWPPLPNGHQMQHLMGQSFNMDNQQLRFEFSTHTHIPVNTLAKNVVSANLYADLITLIEFIENISPTEESRLRALYSAPPFNATGDQLERLISEHQSEQNSFINNVMNDRFNNMLYFIDIHASQARREYTDIGSRGRRLELIQNRLEQDNGSLYRLKTNNEAADLARVATLMATAEAQFMAAMRVGTRIIHVTLANFLQL